MKGPASISGRTNRKIHPLSSEIQEIYQKLGDLVADESLSAVVESVYALEQFKEAFDQSLKSNRGGKILFKLASELPIDDRYACSFYQENEMSQSRESKNKALVLKAFDTLFNQRDYVAAERFWSPNYMQHSAHIGPGREGLFNLIKGAPSTLKYEPGVIVAEGDFVIIHGRFSGNGRPRSWIAADVVRIADDVLVEHWDVLQDEATRAESKSGLPMFGDSFAD
jgi:predicted SnoaL-like aldol condensation-catalyzing enzyme